jgi:hypothetical protein
MIKSFAKALLLVSISSLVFSCSSKEVAYTFDNKPISSVENKDGNIVVHFKDRTTQSFSVAQAETLLKEKKIEKNVYQLFTQKIKDAASHKQQKQKLVGKADKEEPYPYKLNGIDVHYVELKDDKYIIHLANKTSHTLIQHELDCMFLNEIITPELYMKCFQKQNEKDISERKNPSKLYFNYREIECPEFNQ